MNRDKPIGPAPGLAEAPTLRDEHARADALGAFGFESLEDDAELQSIANFAAQLCAAPISMIGIVEAQRERILAGTGSNIREIARSQSFCAHAMLGDGLMLVPDTLEDPRFAQNELVTGSPHIRFYAGMPLTSREGIPLGALCVIDTSPRPKGLTALQQSGLEVLSQAVMRRLAARRAARTVSAQVVQSTKAMREIADLLPVIVWSANEDGEFDYFNDQWERITGQPTPAETRDWRTVVHPEDADKAFEAWEKSFRKGEPFESEYRLRQFDGVWRWTLSRALPLRDRSGKITRWYGTLTDVDSGRRDFESRDLLARELSHRIKNIFAVVAGLVSLRARRRPELKDFSEELGSAIRALGRAHDFVRPLEGIKGSSLIGLLRELMAPYSGPASRVSIDGVDCEIGPRAATPLALVFHELATNAAKYGALSVEGGSVEITVDCGSDDGLSRVTWRERNGPELIAPASEGFGTRLLAMAIEGQLGGRFDRRYVGTGLEIDLEIPMAGITT